MAQYNNGTLDLDTAMVKQEVKLTSQHQITVPKRIREALGLKGGDRLELVVSDTRRALLVPKKLIDADDPAYHLGQQILEAELQIRQGKVVPWSAIKRRHGL